MKKALIFGICGFVGPYLCKELSENGYEVYGSDLQEFHSNVLKIISYRKCDILNKDNLVDLIQDIRPDVIVNLAAISSVGLSWKEPWLAFQVNVIGAINILEAVRSVAINPDILLVGSSEEYRSSDKPLREDSPLDINNPYGISKCTQESIARLYNKSYSMKIHYVRAFNHTGVGQKDSFVIPSFCKRVKEAKKLNLNKIIVGNIDVYRDFSDVRDVVYAYRLVLEKGDADMIYNIGSGMAYKLEDILDMVLGIAQISVDIVIDEALVRPSDIKYICCDNFRIKADLGWTSKYSLYDTIQAIYNSF